MNKREKRKEKTVQQEIGKQKRGKKEVEGRGKEEELEKEEEKDSERRTSKKSIIKNLNYIAT